MKKILFVLVVGMWLFFVGVSVVRAEELFYCNCFYGTAKPATCASFTSSTLRDNFCKGKPECVSQSIKGQVDGKDVDCSADGAAAKPGAGGSADAGKIVSLKNPLDSGTTDINVIIGNIIKTALGVMGAFVLLMIVYGGFTWLTAAGNPEKVKSGSNTILWAVLGSVVVLGSYFMLQMVLTALSGSG